MCVCLLRHYLGLLQVILLDWIAACGLVCVCMYICVCVCVHICLSVFHQCVDLPTREAPVELALCDQPSVVPVKVLVARPDADPLVLVKLLAPL